MLKTSALSFLYGALVGLVVVGYEDGSFVFNPYGLPEADLIIMSCYVILFVLVLAVTKDK